MLRDKSRKAWMFEHLSSKGPNASSQSWTHLGNVKKGGLVVLRLIPATPGTYYPTITIMLRITTITYCAPTVCQALR